MILDKNILLLVFVLVLYLIVCGVILDFALYYRYHS
ncbi:hypothetical protein O9A_00577 [Bartonella koehlerae C-29]|uniref:Uncharacterized protein n=1 Tax=Bartonella koehlerae C-29 TaxID=1134510 RepID=A0A067WHA6_9HYPH|nr:hypothetical protein O9A_00577 [Bartonella koehlerae C-29]